MARRTTHPTEKKVALELLTSREDAEQKLMTRIEKGKALLKIEIRTSSDFDSAGKEYAKWNDFNKELLKRTFTSDELSLEYDRWSGVGVVMMREPSLGEEISTLCEDISERCHRLESIIERLELIPISSTVSTAAVQQPMVRREIDKKKIFVVHGQDDVAKLEVARFIEKIGFEPIILHEQASGSKTIIEKIEAYSDVGFGIVIYSPCDLGGRNSSAPDLKGRARQNVVFEHGFLIGKLGRPRVCALLKGTVETPNDISGVVYTPMDTSNWHISLAKELRAAGYSVDMNKVV